MYDFTGIEEFCFNCDKSSREYEGKYFNNAWFCTDCYQEVSNRPIDDEERVMRVGQMIKELEDDS